MVLYSGQFSIKIVLRDNSGIYNDQSETRLNIYKSLPENNNGGLNKGNNFNSKYWHPVQTKLRGASQIFNVTWLVQQLGWPWSRGPDRYSNGRRSRQSRGGDWSVLIHLRKHTADTVRWQKLDKLFSWRHHLTFRFLIFLFNLAPFLFQIFTLDTGRGKG